MTGTQETSVDAVMCHPSAPSGTKDSPPPPADAAMLPEHPATSLEEMALAEENSSPKTMLLSRGGPQPTTNQHGGTEA